MLYSYCAENDIPYRRVGKLVVGREEQRAYLAKMHAKARGLRAPPHWNHSADPHVLPTEMLSGNAARERVPELAHDVTSALWSPSTGIVDSAALLRSLEKDVEDAGGAIAYATRAVRIDGPAAAAAKSSPASGWVVQTVTSAAEGSESKPDATLARVL